MSGYFSNSLNYMYIHVQNQGQFPSQPKPEHKVTLTLSAYHVKIVCEDQSQTLLHRIPIHEVAAASYVNDDDQHLLFLKAGNEIGSKNYNMFYN